MGQYTTPREGLKWTGPLEFGDTPDDTGFALVRDEDSPSVELVLPVGGGLKSIGSFPLEGMGTCAVLTGQFGNLSERRLLAINQATARYHVYSVTKTQ